MGWKDKMLFHNIEIDLPTYLDIARHARLISPVIHVAEHTPAIWDSWSVLGPGSIGPSGRRGKK